MTSQYCYKISDPKGRHLLRPCSVRPLVSFAALTSVGAKVATVYWAMSEAHRQVVDACSIHAIDMTLGKPNGFPLLGCCKSSTPTAT